MAEEDGEAGEVRYAVPAAKAGQGVMIPSSSVPNYIGSGLLLPDGRSVPLWIAYRNYPVYAEMPSAAQCETTRVEWEAWWVARAKELVGMDWKAEELETARRWCSVLEESRELWVIRAREAEQQARVCEYEESVARREGDEARDRVGALLREVRALRKLTGHVVVSAEASRLMAEWDEVAVAGIPDE